jgi:hypothetical protein
MKRWYSILFGAALSLGACVYQPSVRTERVPAAESVVRSEGQAIRIALDFARSSDFASSLRLETARAFERPADWHVSIDRLQDTIPAIRIVSVDKRTGAPAWVAIEWERE